MDSSANSDELAAPFMVAEFTTLTDRILEIEKTRTTRVNYYIVIVSAAIAGITLVTGSNATNPPTSTPILVTAILLAVFLIGIAILRENLTLAAQAVFMFRRAGRIRCWFLDKSPSILSYLPWSPGDDTPTFLADPDHSTFAGKDSILWLGNSVSVAALLLSILLSFTFLLPVASWLISGAVCIGLWAAQNVYIGYKAEKYEKMGKERGRIHFPRERGANTASQKKEGNMRKLIRWIFGLTPR